MHRGHDDQRLNPQNCDVDRAKIGPAQDRYFAPNRGGQPKTMTRTAKPVSAVEPIFIPIVTPLIAQGGNHNQGKCAGLEQ